MEYILALTLSAIFTIIFISFKKKNSSVSKSKIIKKYEIIDNYKKEILTNIINAAESYRDEYSPLNYAKKLKDWNAYD